MYNLIYIVIGYFVGCIQSAYLVGRFLGKIDIREHGSGNAGSTNVLRVMGKKAGALTFLVDILKPFLALIICTLIFKINPQISGIIYPEISVIYPRLSLVMYSGLGVIIGHNWPVFLKFKGGKGVASAIGIVFILLDWRITLVSYAIGILTIVITKYVSAGSVLFSISLPILFSIFGYDMECIVVATVIMLLIVYKHIPNIQRLLKGTENKLGAKKE